MFKYILPRSAVLFLQHHLNPMHVMCRLKNRGYEPSQAMDFCRKYEKFLYRFFL